MSNKVTPEEMLKTSSVDTKPTTDKANIIKPAVKINTVKTNPDSTALTQLNQLIDTWVKAWENKDKPSITRSFKGMINHVLKHQDDKSVLDAWRKLFIKYRDSYLRPDQALVGIFKMTELEANRIALAFELMSELVNPNRDRTIFDMQYAAKILNNPKCRIPNGYVAYVAERLR